MSPVGTPKKKILPPATVKTPGIKRAIGQMMSSVEKNRLLDEVIELKGELNRMKILNEELQADLATTRGELVTTRGELKRKKRKSAVFVTKTKPAPNVKPTKTSYLRAQVFEGKKEGAEKKSVGTKSTKKN